MNYIAIGLAMFRGGAGGEKLKRLAWFFLLISIG